jgi:hypothetical protein
MSTNDFLLSRLGDPIKRLMRYNPNETNSRQGGAIHFLAEQNVDAILAANRADADIDQSKNVFRHVARVPLSIWDQACREGWSDDNKAWARWLRDPDNRAFLVNGKV